MLPISMTLSTAVDVMAPGNDGSSPAKISQSERFSFGSGEFSDIGAPTLVSVLQAAERGDIRRWFNLGDFILSGSDGWLAGKFHARAMRVAQADFAISPGVSEKYATPADKLAAEMCDEFMRRVPRLTKIFTEQLDAVPMGLAAHYMSWGRARGVYCPESFNWIHGRRFRYDLQWRPRLWDNGASPGPDGYGRIIDTEPAAWMLHQHTTRGVYPGLNGELRKCTKLWLFMSWCSRWWLQNSEKYGSPFIWARVPTSMKDASRAKVKAGLQAISSDHVAVAEEGTELFIETAAAASRAFENFSEFLNFAKAQLTEQVLGSSDAAGPGENGSNAAVTTRMGALTDPLMIADGIELAETWRECVFKWIVYFNRHKFGPGELPSVPEMKFLTADDEVKVDQGDKAQEQGMTPSVSTVPAATASREVAALADRPLAIALSAPRTMASTRAKRTTTG